MPPHLRPSSWRAIVARAAARFFDYEARLNTYLADKTMLVLCFYPVPTGRSADVSRTHLSTVSKRRGEWESARSVEKSWHQTRLRIPAKGCWAGLSTLIGSVKNTRLSRT